MNLWIYAYTVPGLDLGMDLVKDIVSRGYDAVIAGGCVRDLAMWYLAGRPGKAPEVHDVDIATNMPMDELRKAYRCASNNGEAHGTLIVIYRGKPFEVTQFRADGDYSDGRHPDSVKWASTFREDASRRDFTMNAMGLDQDGEIVDHFGGLEDIRKGVLRTVGDPMERFSEDALRIVRAFRFAGRYGMAIDPATMAAAQAVAGKLSCVSMERFHDEFTKCAGYGVKAAAAMMEYMANGIGWQIDTAVDWKGAAQDMKRLASLDPIGWESGHLFPLIMPDETAMRRFTCTRDEISAWKYIRATMRKYLEGRLDPVDLVDGVRDPRWPAFRDYVMSRHGYFVLSAGDEHQLRSHEESWPNRNDMSRALAEAGEGPGKAFGEKLRMLRLEVYRMKARGKTVTRDDLNKLVASVRET